MMNLSSADTPSLVTRFRVFTHRFVVLTPEWYDVVLYGLAAVFALGASLFSHIPLYRQWGDLALGPYVAAALVAVGLARRARTREVMKGRVILAALVVLGATVVPMVCEISWRFSVTPQSLHVQPEVVVIERAADALAHGHDPYQAQVVNGHLEGAAQGLPAYESFFPYLPAMTIFGLPSATKVPRVLSDARLYFFLATLVCLALALRYGPGAPERKLKVMQVAIALPWAALTIATGGDDIPIVALLLVAMVLAQRRRPGWSGLVFGLACAMKFTAWPVALLALFAARNKENERKPLVMLMAIGAVGVPLVMGALWWNVGTFIANVIEFPLGLAGIASPAGSGLPGHLFVTAFPALRKVFVVVSALAGVTVLVTYLRNRPPQDASAVCRVAGWSLTGAILLAPSTRIGYLIYPLNLFVWSWLLTEEASDQHTLGQQQH